MQQLYSSIWCCDICNTNAVHCVQICQQQTTWHVTKRTPLFLSHFHEPLKSKSSELVAFVYSPIKYFMDML
jgi:hypothetical protein